jgi:hypothetical protein
MFISKSNNFIYLRVPKTGSTSMSNYLRDKLGDRQDSFYTRMNLFNLPSNLPSNYEFLTGHATVREIQVSGIVDFDFVSKANIYACLREPVERFLTHCYHIRSSGNYSETQSMDKNQLVEFCLTKYNPVWFMWWPQTMWCELDGQPVNKVFLYENFDKAAEEMTGVVGVVNYRHRDNTNNYADTTSLDNSLVQQIEILYKDDVALYKKLKANHR